MYFYVCCLRPIYNTTLQKMFSYKKPLAYKIQSRWELWFSYTVRDGLHAVRLVVCLGRTLMRALVGHIAFILISRRVRATTTVAGRPE